MAEAGSDLEAIKKELVKIIKKLGSTSTKKHIDALNALNELIAKDVRAVKPAYKQLAQLLHSGTEEERFLTISLIRNVAKINTSAALPLLNGLVENARYPIFGPDLRISIPGCRIRTNAIVAIINIGREKPQIFKDDSILAAALENIEPPVYINKSSRPSEVNRLYIASLKVIKIAFSANPAVVKEKIPVILNLLNDPEIDIKINAALTLEEISLNKPEYLYEAVNRLSSVLKYPIYRPDTSDQKLADLYICVLATLNNIAEKKPAVLHPILNLLSGILRDSFKYERWARDSEASGSFRNEITELIQKMAVSEPGPTSIAIAPHLKDVEGLRKYVFNLLNEISQDHPDDVVNALAPLLTEENANGKQMAVHLLGEIGERAPDSVRGQIPVIVRLLEDRYIHVRQRAAYTLGKIGSVKPEYVKATVPSLVPLLSDPYEAVRIYTIDAIARIGMNHPKFVVAAIPSLMKLLDDQNVKVKQMSMAALKKLGVDVRMYSTLLKKMQTVNRSTAAVRARGASPEIIEGQFQAAKKEMQEANWDEAMKRIETAEKLLEFVMKQSRPAIDVKFIMDTRANTDGWSPVKLDIANKGSAHAKDVKVFFTDGIDLKGSSTIPVLESKSGVQVKIEGRPVGDMGATVTMHITYADFDDKKYEYMVEGKIEEVTNIEYRDPYNPRQQDELLMNFMAELGLDTGGFREEHEEAPTIEGNTPAETPADTVAEPQVDVAVEKSATEADEAAPTEDEGEEFPTVEGGNDSLVDSEPVEAPMEDAPAGNDIPEESDTPGEEQSHEGEGTEDNAPSSWEKAGEDEFINCPNCGAKIPADSVFCYKCGKKVRE